MQHTEFSGNRPTDTGEEDFAIYGRGSHLGHVTKISRTKYQCHYPRTRGPNC